LSAAREAAFSSASWHDGVVIGSKAFPLQEPICASRDSTIIEQNVDHQPANIDEMNRELRNGWSYWQVVSNIVAEMQVCVIPEQSISEAKWLINFEEDAGYTECFAFRGLRQLASAGTLCRIRKMVLTNRLSPQHSSGLVEKKTFAITRKNSLADMQINRLTMLYAHAPKGSCFFSLTPA